MFSFIVVIPCAAAGQQILLYTTLYKLICNFVILIVDLRESLAQIGLADVVRRAELLQRGVVVAQLRVYITE